MFGRHKPEQALIQLHLNLGGGGCGAIELLFWAKGKISLLFHGVFLAPWSPAGPPALIPSDNLCYKCVWTEPDGAMDVLRSVFVSEWNDFFFFSPVFLNFFQYLNELQTNPDKKQMGK